MMLLRLLRSNDMHDVDDDCNAKQGTHRGIYRAKLQRVEVVALVLARSTSHGFVSQYTLNSISQSQDLNPKAQAPDCKH